MGKKYMILVDDKFYYVRLDENTFIIAKDKESGKVFTSLNEVSIIKNSMLSMSKDFGKTENIKIIEVE